jgi:glycosyltransferase involved in cell wall biosynthesis
MDITKKEKMVSGNLKKVLFLYTNTAGYMERCWEHLRTLGICNIQVFCYNDNLPVSRSYLFFKKTPGNFKTLSEMVYEYNPEIIFISGWSNFNYLLVGHLMRKKGVKVVGLSDTPFKGNFRQWLGRITAFFIVHPVFDYFWVCGDKQKKLITYLKYPAHKIKTCLYTCDHSLFYPEKLMKQNKFIFIGKKNSIKGWDTLKEVYESYKKLVKDPWKLEVIDGGDPKTKIPYIKIPLMLRNSDCLILPSRYEPWGMVIQEAVASGCTIIASKQCGSTEVFVKQNENGFLFNASNSNALLDCMLRMHEISDNKLLEMKFESCYYSFEKNINLWENQFRFFLSTIRGL